MCGGGNSAIMPYIKQYIDPIIKPCEHCGRMVGLEKSGWQVKYVYCPDNPDCQAAKKEAAKERNKGAVKKTYKKHGGIKGYQESIISKKETGIAPPPPAPTNLPICSFPGCKSPVHVKYGVIYHKHCAKHLRTINNKAKAIQASWFPEASLYF